MKLEVSLMIIWVIRHISTATLTNISPSDNNEVQSHSFRTVRVLGTQQPPYDHWDSGSNNNYNRRNTLEKINGKGKNGRVPRGKATATLEPTTLRLDSTMAPTIVPSMQKNNLVRPQSYKNKGEKGKGMMSYKKYKSSTNPSLLPTQDPTESKHSLRTSKSKEGKSEKNVFGGMKSKTAKTFSKGKGYPYDDNNDNNDDEDDDEDDDKSLDPTPEPTALVTKMPSRHYYAMKYYPMKNFMSGSSSRSTKYLVKKTMDSDKGMSSTKKLTKSQIGRSSSSKTRRGWPSIDEDRDTPDPISTSTVHPRTLAPTEDNAIMTTPTQTPDDDEEPAASEAPITFNNFTGSPTYVMTPTQAPVAVVTPVNSTQGPVETTLTPSQAPTTSPLSNSTQEPATTPSYSTLAPATSPSNPTQSPTQSTTTVPIITTTQAPSMIPINSSTLAPIIPVNATQSPTVPSSTREPLIIPINSTQSPTGPVVTVTQSPTIVPAPTTNATQEPSNPNDNSTLAPITLERNTVIDYEACAEDLISADVNNNDAIDISEYLIFVQEYGKHNKCVDVAADELTLEQTSAFNLLACVCRFEAGADPDCCVADNAKLSISAMLLDSSNRTQEQADFLITICSLTDASIDYQCGAVPAST